MQRPPFGLGPTCRVFVDKMVMINRTTGGKNRRKRFRNRLKGYPVIHHLRNAAGRGSDKRQPVLNALDHGQWIVVDNRCNDYKPTGLTNVCQRLEVVEIVDDS